MCDPEVGAVEEEAGSTESGEVWGGLPAWSQGSGSLCRRFTQSGRR